MRQRVPSDPQALRHACARSGKGGGKDVDALSQSGRRGGADREANLRADANSQRRLRVVLLLAR